MRKNCIFSEGVHEFAEGGFLFGSPREVHFILEEAEQRSGCDRESADELAVVAGESKERANFGDCFGVGKLRSLSSFLGSGLMPSLLTICPRYSTLATTNRHFDAFNRNPASISLSKTIVRSLR